MFFGCSLMCVDNEKKMDRLSMVLYKNYPYTLYYSYLLCVIPHVAKIN